LRRVGLGERRCNRRGGGGRQIVRGPWSLVLRPQSVDQGPGPRTRDQGLCAEMDLYELLGLARGATLIEIKRSYSRLARKYHPDINPGDNAAEAQFREITRAYETLSDPERRLQYDAAGAVAESTTVTFGFEGFDFSAGGGHSTATTFGDLFAEVFSHRQEPR